MQCCEAAFILMIEIVGDAQAGGSGVVVSPITYIFEEEPARWRKLLDSLDLEE